MSAATDNAAAWRGNKLGLLHGAPEREADRHFSPFGGPTHAERSEWKQQRPKTLRRL